MVMLFRCLDEPAKAPGNMADIAETKDEVALPKAPVPSLASTLASVVDYASVVGPPADVDVLRALARDFQEGRGKAAQQTLMGIAEEEDNWINRFWLAEMYLANRVCLPTFSNPAYVFPVQDFPDAEAQLRYAAALVRGVATFKQLCDEGKVALPKAPVPSLASTLASVVDYASVIGPPADVDVLRALARDFQEGRGKAAQQTLMGIAEEEDNWINRFWLAEMYLANRVCLPTFSNPAYVFPVQDFPDAEAQLRYAAALVRGVATFKQLCDEGKVPQELSTGKVKVPFCMDQYSRVLSSHRAAATPSDVHLRSPPAADQHALVSCHNQLFTLAIKTDGEWLSEQRIRRGLEGILKAANRRPRFDVFPVALLTSPDRDVSAAAFELLQQNAVNAESISLVSSAAFGLCLDRDAAPLPGGPETRAMAAAALHLLHGHGPEGAMGNRWYDKTLSFVVADSGVVGLNMEHSVAEGIVIINLVQHALRHVQDSLSKKPIPDPSLPCATAKALRWEVSGELAALMSSSVRPAAEAVARDLQMELVEWRGWGREWAKANKASPDAIIQLSLQLAQFITHGALVSTYESCSLRRFRLGRVDNIRAAHPPALLFCQAATDENQTKDQKRQALRAALERQVAVMSANAAGTGIDNHVCALGVLDREAPGGPHQLFQHHLLQELLRFPLSTSQVATAMPGSFLCYGPVVEDGYGCAYNPQPHHLLFALSALKGHPRTDIARMAQAIPQALGIVQGILEE